MVKKPTLIGTVASKHQLLSLSAWLDEKPRLYVLSVSEAETEASFVMDTLTLNMMESLLRVEREKPAKAVALKAKAKYAFLADDDSDPLA